MVEPLDLDALKRSPWLNTLPVLDRRAKITLALIAELEATRAERDHYEAEMYASNRGFNAQLARAEQAEAQRDQWEENANIAAERQARAEATIAALRGDR